MDDGAAHGESGMALGAMSGTSLDGIDWAMLETDGERIVSFGPSGYRAYSGEERAILRGALGLWEGPEVDAASDLVTRLHAETLGAALDEMDALDLAGAAREPEGQGGRGAGRRDSVLVGFHGQTVVHDPGGRGTLQVGDGDRLAQELGVPVAWDFRSADVAAGGEGAPLAPFYHHACARRLAERGELHENADAPLAFLNLGGVGNLTWVDPRARAPEEPGALLAFDTGPANAPVNDLVHARLGREMDVDGALAASGTVDEGVVGRFLEHRYFERPAPKSLDRDAFGDLADLVGHLGDADAAATLLAACVGAVARGLSLCPEAPGRVIVCGGGRRNPALMGLLGSALPCPAIPAESAGLDGDMMEAQAFAFLAQRARRGLPLTCPGTTGVAEATPGGRVSLSDRA